MTMRIGDFDIGERVLVIAEIGNNHEGDVQRAREMVEAAAASGAHAVKFQTFRTERLVARQEAARFAQLKRFELSPEEFTGLGELAHSRGLLFISTALDPESAALLEEIADAIKIASADNTHGPLIRAVAEGERPLLISTGMADLTTLERAVGEVEAARGQGEQARLALLQCTSAYPAPPDELNLRAIPYLGERLGHPIGYSDHSLGNEAALAAVALGARIIEKHFTLEGIDSDFRDHSLSATPPELRSLVQSIESVTAMLGEPAKALMPSEAGVMEVARRSIRAARDLTPGEIVREEDLDWMRPAGGLPPGQEDRLVGRRVLAAVRAGEPLLPEQVE